MQNYEPFESISVIDLFTKAEKKGFFALKKRNICEKIISLVSPWSSNEGCEILIIFVQYCHELPFD